MEFLPLIQTKQQSLPNFTSLSTMTSLGWSPWLPSVFVSWWSCCSASVPMAEHGAAATVCNPYRRRLRFTHHPSSIGKFQKLMNNFKTYLWGKLLAPNNYSFLFIMISKRGWMLWKVCSMVCLKCVKTRIYLGMKKRDVAARTAQPGSEISRACKEWKFCIHDHLCKKKLCLVGNKV